VEEGGGREKRVERATAIPLEAGGRAPGKTQLGSKGGGRKKEEMKEKKNGEGMIKNLLGTTKEGSSRSTRGKNLPEKKGKKQTLRKVCFHRGPLSKNLRSFHP